VCPTEDNGCPIEDKGCCSIEDKSCCPQRTRELTNKLEPIIQTKPKLEPKPSITILIKGGSHTTLDREPDCYNSCTIYRGLCPVPTRSDFITFQRLENLHVAMLAKHNHTFFGVRRGDHYMPLQRFTLGSMTCLAKVSPQRPLLYC
jgi:hypothetical protein